MATSKKIKGVRTSFKYQMKSPYMYVLCGLTKLNILAYSGIRSYNIPLISRKIFP